MRKQYTSVVITTVVFIAAMIGLSYGAVTQVGANFFGLSSNATPTQAVPNRSLFVETDTGKVFLVTATGVRTLITTTVYSDTTTTEVVQSMITASGVNTAMTVTAGYVQSIQNKIQSLGTKTGNFTIDLSLGMRTSFTTSASVMTVTITAPDSTNYAYNATLAITNGNPVRAVTLVNDSTIRSSGGLMSSGDTLPNSGASTLDIFTLCCEFGYCRMCNAEYDVKL